MDPDRMKDAVAKANRTMEDKSDKSREARQGDDKSGKAAPPPRGFSAADDPTRTDRTPIDNEASVDSK